MSGADYREPYRGKTILVTGGAGAIGSNLTRALGELGTRMVLVLDDLSSRVPLECSEPPQRHVRGGEHSGRSGAKTGLF